MTLTVYEYRYSTRKAAIEGAIRANRGHRNQKVQVNDAHGTTRMKKGTASIEQKKEHHNKNYKGDHSNHVHSTDKKGKKLEDSMHHLFPGKSK